MHFDFSFALKYSFFLKKSARFEYQIIFLLNFLMQIIINQRYV